MAYNPNLPSTHYDEADKRALMASNIPAGLVGDEYRLDTAEDVSVFFARELDFIKSKAYEKEYPDFTALSLFPITHEVPEGAQTVTYYSYDKTGMASIISNYSDDLPRADVVGEPTTASVKSLGASYGYSIDDMRASKYARKSLDTRRANAARFAIDKKINQIAFAGDEKNKLVGVLTPNNNVPLYTLSTTSGGSTKWKDKTADEILADINGMVQYQSRITQDIEKSNTLLLPPSVFLDISTRRIPDTQTTIMKFILDNAPYLKKIISAPELMAENTSTNPLGADVAFLFNNSAEKFSLEIPLAFIQHSLQQKNLEIIVPCESKIAGCLIYYPMSMLISVGV